MRADAMDVFFFEAFAEEEELLRTALPGHVSAGFFAGAVQESEAMDAPPARIISIRTQSVPPNTWRGEVEAVLSRTTGYDHIGAWTANIARSPVCGYLPEYCTRAVAEQAAMLWMALLRKLPAQISQMNQFNRSGITGTECDGKNILVVGVGRIGGEVVNIARGLGMNVKGVDPVRKRDDVEYVDFDTGLSSADVLVCAMNLTDANRGFFKYDRLAACRKGMIFVNVSRGELSPAGDLATLLKQERLGGVGLDVYNDEPAVSVGLRSGVGVGRGEAADVLSLASCKNAILTPHNAFNTSEALNRKASQTVEQAVCFLKNGRFKWTVPDSE